MNEYASQFRINLAPARTWRRRLDRYQGYKTATAQCRRLLATAREVQLRGQADPSALARHAESETLAAYTRLLKM